MRNLYELLVSLFGLSHLQLRACQSSVRLLSSLLESCLRNLLLALGGLLCVHVLLLNSLLALLK